MSWLSKAVKKVGKVAGKVGKVVGTVASKAAPLIAMVPGVGTLGGAALGAGGALLSGENVGTALKRGALGAAGGLAGGTVRGLIGGAAKKLLGGGLPSAPEIGGTMASPEAGGRSLLGRIGGAVGDAGGAALRYAGQHPATVLQGGLAALGTIQGAQQQGGQEEPKRDDIVDAEFEEVRDNDRK
jgi:hypothetical protein